MSKRRKGSGCGSVVVFVALGLAVYMLNMPKPEAPAAATAAPAPTMDIAAAEATNAAIAPTLKAALVVLTDLQGVREVSAMMVDGAWYVNVNADIAGADDVPETMERIRAAITVQPVTNLRVTSYVQDVPQRTWLWENGEWSNVVVK